MSYTQINERLIPVKQYVVPTTGQTVTINSNGCVNLIMNPAGALVTLTITAPANPQDGDGFTITTSQAVTTLTMNGATFVGALATLSIASFATYVYNSDSTTWYRLG